MAAMAGMSAACGISQQQEVQIGAEQSQQVNAQLPIVKDPVVNRYLNILGDSLAHVTSRADLDWHFYMVNTNDFNAFALPGGYIYVNRGVAERSDKHGPVRVGDRARDRTRRASPLGEADGADAGRERRRHGRLRAHRACATAGIAQAGINVAGSGGVREVQPRRRSPGRRRRRRRAGSRGHQPERHAARCSRSCSPSVSRSPRRSRRGSRTTRSRKAASRRRADQIAKINPAIMRTLTANTQAFNDFRARVRQLPPPPVASR